MDTGWLENLLDRQAAGDDEISRLKAELAEAKAEITALKTTKPSKRRRGGKKRRRAKRRNKAAGKIQRAVRQRAATLQRGNVAEPQRHAVAPPQPPGPSKRYYIRVDRHTPDPKNANRMYRAQRIRAAEVCFLLFTTQSGNLK